MNCVKFAPDYFGFLDAWYLYEGLKGNSVHIFFGYKAEAVPATVIHMWIAEHTGHCP